jgi:acyl-CoA synthetase (AMP-forming)/AMP-acid ligase II
LRSVPVEGSTAAAAVRNAVASTHGLHVQDVRLVPQGSLLMTSSGKVQRRACKKAYLANEWPG